MCGIGGWLAGTSEEGDLSEIGARLTSSLAHRGPDASGVKTFLTPRAVLAHVRLKVIDLTESGRQPFLAENEDIALVFNGEIYNFQELRRSLEEDGVQFRSRSDTEVILRQYQERGMMGLDALDGMFAFALLDRREGRLVLMRDRAGKKPLYFAETPRGGFAFGSEPKALMVCPGVDLTLERAYIPEFLAYGYVATPRTLFRGIRKLQAGHRLVLDVRTGSRRVERYWSMDALRPRAEMTRQEAIFETRRLVAAAVRKRLVSDVPIGAFLSGGVDSSVIVAEMARQSSRRVRTFAVGFDDEQSFDETLHAREVARRFDTDHMEIRIDSAHGAGIENLLAYYDEPYGDSSGIALHAIAQATRQHVTVALTGDGGDEVFAGYTRFQGALLPTPVPQRLAPLLRQVLRRIPHVRGYKSPLSLMMRFLEHADRDSNEQLLAWNSYFAGRELKALLRSDVFGPDFDPWLPLAEQREELMRLRTLGRDRLDQVLHHNFGTYLLEDLLVKVDRMTMAVALEARSPFLDTALIEAVFRMPSNFKIRYGAMKWMLKEAYRGVLPSSILDRRKHGFGVPVHRWWNSGARTLVDDLLLGEGGRIFEFLEREQVRRLLGQHRSAIRDHGQRIFLLLQLELWLRRYPSVRSGPS